MASDKITEEYSTLYELYKGMDWSADRQVVDEYFMECGRLFKDGAISEDEFCYRTFSLDILNIALSKEFSAKLISVDHSGPTFPIRIAYKEWKETGSFEVEPWMEHFVFSEEDIRLTMEGFFQLVDLLRIPISYFDSLNLAPDKIPHIYKSYKNSSVNMCISDDWVGREKFLERRHSKGTSVHMMYYDNTGKSYYADIEIIEDNGVFGDEGLIYLCEGTIDQYFFGQKQTLYLNKFGELSFNYKKIRKWEEYKYLLNSIYYPVPGEKWQEYNEALYKKGLRVEAEYKALRYGCFELSGKGTIWDGIDETDYESMDFAPDFDEAKAKIEKLKTEKEKQKLAEEINKIEEVAKEKLEKFSEFHLSETGKSELMGYFRYLLLDTKKNRSYHFILQTDSDNMGIKFADRLLDITGELGKKINRIKVTESEMLSPHKDKMEEIWGKNAVIITDALSDEQYYPSDDMPSNVIYEKKNYDKTWETIADVFQNKIVIFCVPRDILHGRIKANSVIYYRFFRHHIFLANMTEDEIVSYFLEKVKKEIGGYSDGFPKAFREYINTVYQKADLKNMEFIDNLFDWMIDLSYQKIGNCEMFTEESIPYYHRNVSFEELNYEFQNLVGLGEVKETFRDMGILCQSIAGGKEMPNIHMVFRGNPGTGKTTVAKKVAKLFSSMGIIKKNHVEEVSATDLLGMYTGHTGPKIKRILKRAEGGILFIDQAHVLAPKRDEDSFQKQALSELSKGMEKKNDPVIIFSGYVKEMGDFLKADAGLASKIGYDITFPDYTDEELLRIFEYMCDEAGYGYDNKTIDAVHSKIISMRYEENFGNARSVESIFSQSKIESLKRDPKGFFISEKDIIISKNAKTYEVLKKELDELIGISDAKMTIMEQVLSNKFSKENNKDLPSANHMIFAGNPGTGKTTTARIFSEMLFSIGVAKSPRTKMITAKDLYVPDPAEKLNEYCKEALGGVLFIDEIYMLSIDTYRVAQVVSVLLEILEEKKEDITFILAGYEKQMKEFLDENPGLSSRFPITVKFNDFTEEELCEIFIRNIENGGMDLDKKGLEKFKEVIREEKKKDNFGNGRTVRNIYEDAFRRHAVNYYTKNEKGKFKSDVITAEDIAPPAIVYERKTGKLGF